MPVEPGQMLSHFRLVEKIGEGGMGVVWKALDTHLDREVAIKVLPEELANDPERLGRFKREAKAVASLDHPNIVTVHSVEEAEGVHFITMGLVRGKSLTELIPGKGLPLGKFFDQAIALADAISSAHQQGITHRDLKPDNVMIGDDGRLKVLDFGLAKLREEARAADGTQLPTATVTQEGKILGTVAYMSPEQAEGKPIDHRSDIFSMGVMLYQMATGQRPFKGDTSVSIISSIMKDTPDSITELNQTLPRHLGRIVRQCLQKEPDRRYQTVKDLCNQLVELKEEVDSGETIPAGVASGGGPRKRSSLLIGSAAIAVVVVVAGYFLIDRWRGPGGIESAPLNLTFKQLTSQPGQELFPSLSPDGRSLAYSGSASGNWDIYLQRVGGENPINLTADCGETDTQPAFSPDGDWIAFRSERDGGGIFLMGATGESVRRIADLGFNPVWSANGREILVTTQSIWLPGSLYGGSGLWAIDVVTGERRKIMEGAHQPHASPDGGRIAYWDAPAGQRDLWTIPESGGEAVRVTNDAATDWNPVWSPDGRYLYFASDRGGSTNLWRIPLDAETGATLGGPEAITTGATASRYHLSISADGRRIAYVEAIGEHDIYRIAFDPIEEAVEGLPIPVIQSSRDVSAPELSPDGEWVIFVEDETQEDLFIAREDGTGRRQLTDDPHKDRGPRWSPEGERIGFYSNRSGRYESWTIKPDGSDLRQLTSSGGTGLVWAPDGARLCTSDAIWDLSKPLEERTPEALPPINEAGDMFFAGDWSPDGQWLVGVGSRRGHVGAGVAGLFVYSLDRGEYRHVADSSTRFPFPRWLRDSRKLIFVSDGSLFLFDTVTEDQREILRLDPPAKVEDFSIAPDNRTIYFTRRVEDSDIWMLTLE